MYLPLPFTIFIFSVFILFERRLYKMNYTYKFRIYPNETQKQLIEKTFGCCRFVYNYFLDKRIKVYEETKETLNFYSCCKQLTSLKKELPWLKEVDSTSLQSSLKDLDTAYQNFWKLHNGYPKFKSKKNYKNSFKMKMGIKFINNKHIQLPKLKSIKCKISKEVEGKILSTTIHKFPSGKYYISILVEKPDFGKLESTGLVVGIDLGIKDFCITSDSLKIPNPHFLKTSEKKLIREQHRLSRKPRGSHNYEKQRIKLARIYEKINNQRTDFLQKLSTQFIKNYDIICLETLKVKNMVKNHNLAKSILDCSWSTFINMLQYKSDWYGRVISKINTFYPSSKTCSNCGYKLDNLTLDVREWICPNCGTSHDRDINAANNILKEGLKLLSL